MKRKRSKTINSVLFHDILWHIFSYNALDDEVGMEHRLKTTFRSSHVCQIWRNILLESPSIWSCMNYVNTFHDKDEGKYPTKPELSQEVLRRSAGLPLWVQATVCAENLSWSRRTIRARDILIDLLSTHWTRIQHLTIYFIGEIPIDDPFKGIIAHLTKQSNTLLEYRMINLMIFSSRFDPFYGDPSLEPFFDSTDSYLRFWQQDLLRISPKFFYSAHSSLRFCQEDILGIAPKASSLFGLTTTLVTSDTVCLEQNIKDTLIVLAGMPMLTHLELAHSISHLLDNACSIAELPITNLRSLKYMFLRGSPLNSFALIDRIKGSTSGTLINVSIIITPTGRDLPLLYRTLLAIYERIFVKNIQLKHPDGVKWLFASIDQSEITLADRGCFSKQNSITFTPLPSSKGLFFNFRWDETTEQFSLLQKLVSNLPHFKELTTLRLRLTNLTLGFCPALTTLSAIKTLEIPIRTLMPYHLAAYEYLSSEGGDMPTYFCNMSTLCIVSDQTHGWTKGDIVERVKMVLRSRERLGLLYTLKLVNFPSDTNFVHLFRGTPGLRRIAVKNDRGKEFEHVYS